MLWRMERKKILLLDSLRSILRGPILSSTNWFLYMSFVLIKAYMLHTTCWFCIYTACSRTLLQFCNVRYLGIHSTLKSHSVLWSRWLLQHNEFHNNDYSQFHDCLNFICCEIHFLVTSSVMWNMEISIPGKCMLVLKACFTIKLGFDQVMPTPVEMKCYAYQDGIKPLQTTWKSNYVNLQ